MTLKIVRVHFVAAAEHSVDGAPTAATVVPRKVASTPDKCQTESYVALKRR